MSLSRSGAVIRSLAVRCLLCLTICAIGIFAQSERGTITGAIRDSSGAVVPGAKISIKNAATNVNIGAVSNGQGEYTVPSLSPGAYSVRVEKEGFRPSLTSGINLDAAQTVRTDVALEVGTSTQAIEVTSSAVQLQT